MLSEAFLKELDEAVPDARVTGVVSWQLPRTAGGAATVLAAIRDAKRPLLVAARGYPGARVNSLDGMPHTILDAPAESWRQLLRDEPELLAGEALVVDANPRVFHIPPAP